MFNVKVAKRNCVAIDYESGVSLIFIDIGVVHLKNAELANKTLQEDKILTWKNLDKYFAFSLDLQKVLAYPKWSVSIAYYKRNMYCNNYLNEGFHNFHNNKINMYVWDESTASRGL